VSGNVINVFELDWLSVDCLILNIVVSFSEEPFSHCLGLVCSRHRFEPDFMSRTTSITTKLK